MKKLLHLSKDLEVPADIATEAVALVGARGSGKTHADGKLAEEFHDAGVQFVWLDPVGVAYGLRLAKDGKAPGLQVPIFGGLHGDVPLEPTGGALVADVVVDRGVSAVLDVSQFESDADKARFVAAFSDRLYQRKKRDPSVIAFIIDEGQEFVPQNPQPGEQMMLHRLVRQIKLGRNFGMGVVLITPRPQEVSKKALNGCQTVLAFRLTGSHERKAMREWIAAHDVDQTVIEKLPSLETGTCHVWSPAFLRVDKQARILPKRTFDASATPKVGERRAARELAPIDLEQLKKDMAATIEKTKAEDPKALRARIAALEHDLSKTIAAKHVVTIAKTEPPKVVEKRVEVPVVTAAALKRAEALVGRLDAITARTMDLRGDVLTELRGVVTTLQKGVPIQVTKAPERPIVTPLPPRWRAPIVVKVATEASPSGSRAVLGPAHQRVLNAVAWLRARGVDAPPRAQVAVLASFTPGSGYYERVVGELKTQGLLAYPSGGLVALTEAGTQAADPGQALQTSEDVQADVMRRLGPAHQKVLRAAIAAYPASKTRADVAAEAGMAAGSGYYERVVGELKTMGVLTYPDKGFLKASDILFVEG